MSEKLNPRRFKILICLLLTAVTLAVYWQVQYHDFTNFDDPDYVTENPHVYGGLNIEDVRWAFIAVHSSNWHPLTWISHMLDVTLYGLNPMGHHFNNLLLHILNTLLLFLLLDRMTAAPRRSAFVAALFALHPLHVESVAWISERKDLLCAFFWFSALWAYSRYAARPGPKRYLHVIILFAMALMSKPMAVTLPFTLLLMDYWPLCRGSSRKGPITADTPSTAGPARPVMLSWRRLAMEKIPFFLLSFLSCGITLLAQRHGGSVIPFEKLPLDIRLGNALLSYARYIEKTIFPHDLAVYYPHTARPVPGWQVFCLVLILVSISFLVVRKAKNHPYLPVGWFWYLGTLVPVIGLVQAGSQAMADRYTYVPLVGIFIMATWGIPFLVKNRPRFQLAVPVAGIIAVAALIPVTRHQIGYWKDSVTLYRHTLRVTTRNHMIHFNLGKALMKRCDFTGAARQFEAALRIKPDSAKAHIELGNALAREGHLHKALAHYREALRLRPDDEIAYTDMGVVLGKQGKFDQAVEYHLRALRIKPDFLNARNNLGLVLAQQGKYRRAVREFRKAFLLEPRNAATHYHLGRVLAAMGDLESARREYHLLESLNPALAGRLLRWIKRTGPPKPSAKSASGPARRDDAGRGGPRS